MFYLKFTAYENIYYWWWTCRLAFCLLEFNVPVYEARNESVNSFGLGYTLQSLGIALLKRLDENYFQALFPNGETPLITQALFKTNNDSRTFDFLDGFSVTRFELMRYLHERALPLGVKIKERKMTPTDVKRLKKSSDLLVGADGVNSIVKRHFTKKFKPQVHTEKLQFSMGYTLANCLHKNQDISTALQHYEQSLQPLFEKPSAQSLKSIKWFEEIDSHFQNTPEADWLEHFRLKDKFHHETPSLTSANTPL